MTKIAAVLSTLLGGCTMEYQFIISNKIHMKQKLSLGHRDMLKHNCSKHNFSLSMNLQYKFQASAMQQFFQFIQNKLETEIDVHRLLILKKSSSKNRTPVCKISRNCFLEQHFFTALPTGLYFTKQKDIAEKALANSFLQKLLVIVKRYPYSPLYVTNSSLFVSGNFICILVLNVF